MAATMKHRRSARKRRLTRGDHRYDQVLRIFKKVKKNGGSLLSKSKITGLLSPAHLVTKDNPEYNGKRPLSNS